MSLKLVPVKQKMTNSKGLPFRIIYNLSLNGRSTFSFMSTHYNTNRTASSYTLNEIHPTTSYPTPTHYNTNHTASSSNSISDHESTSNELSIHNENETFPHDSTKPTFIVDAMLGNVAKKLRLMGFDSLYYSSIEDADLINKAKKENRIILTKDQQLTHDAEKLSITVIQLSSNDEIEQFLQINNKIKIGKYVISVDTTRCSICNGNIQKIEKNQILTKIPKGVLEQHENYWICKSCKKIYWKGTHIKNLQKFIGALNEKF